MKHPAFANLLRRAVAERGLMLKDIAAQIGVARSTVSHWYNGHNLPNMPQAVALAEVLNWPSLSRQAAKGHTSVCTVCGKKTVTRGQQLRIYCTKACALTAVSRRSRQRRATNAGVALHRLRDHQEAVLAHCMECEPDGVCRNKACKLRGVSPLPFVPLSEVRRVA